MWPFAVYGHRNIRLVGFVLVFSFIFGMSASPSPVKAASGNPSMDLYMNSGYNHVIDTWYLNAGNCDSVGYSHSVPSY